MIEVEYSDDGRFFRVISVNRTKTPEGFWMSVSFYAEVPKEESWEPPATEVLKIEPENRRPYYRRVARIGTVHNILHNVMLVPEEDEKIRDWLGCWNLEHLVEPDAED